MRKWRNAARARSQATRSERQEHQHRLRLHGAPGAAPARVAVGARWRSHSRRLSKAGSSASRSVPRPTHPVQRELPDAGRRAARSRTWSARQRSLDLGQARVGRPRGATASHAAPRLTSKATRSVTETRSRVARHRSPHSRIASRDPRAQRAEPTPGASRARPLAPICACAQRTVERPVSPERTDGRCPSCQVRQPGLPHATAPVPSRHCNRWRRVQPSPGPDAGRPHLQDPAPAWLLHGRSSRAAAGLHLRPGRAWTRTARCPRFRRPGATGLRQPRGRARRAGRAAPTRWSGSALWYSRHGEARRVPRPSRACSAPACPARWCRCPGLAMTRCCSRSGRGAGAATTPAPPAREGTIQRDVRLARQPPEQFPLFRHVRAKSARLLPTGTMPICASRSCVRQASAWRAAAFIRSRIGAGVPAGAKMPPHSIHS